MRAWQERPYEVANLLNPSFCSLLLHTAMKGYVREQGVGMPLPLAYLILPIVLHNQTRRLMPRSKRTRLINWVKDHPEVRVQFADRAANLVPFTREALIFAAQSSLVEFNDHGYLIEGSKSPSKIPWAKNTEAYECRQKSQFLGEWLAQAGDVDTVFTVWGVQL